MTSTVEATTRARIGPVAANPYPWPYDSSVDTAHTALICIDWQGDFCGPGRYVDRMGYDIRLTRAGLPATAAMLDHAHATGMLVVHTREGHAPDLSDLPANKRWRSARKVTHRILTGITTDVCVHTTMREADDRGYGCPVLSDCTGATDPADHAAALHMVTMQGGVFGVVATSTAVIEGTTS